MVMLFPIMNVMSRASKDLVFRSDGGVLAASYSKGKLPRTVNALWSGRACDPPCVVGIENEGIAFVWLPGGSVRYYPAGWPRLYPYSLFWVCQVGWWLKSGSSCSGGLNSEPGLIVVPGKASMAVARS